MAGDRDPSHEWITSIINNNIFISCTCFLPLNVNCCWVIRGASLLGRSQSPFAVILVVHFLKLFFGFSRVNYHDIQWMIVKAAAETDESSLQLHLHAVDGGNKNSNPNMKSSSSFICYLISKQLCVMHFYLLFLIRIPLLCKCVLLLIHPHKNSAFCRRWTHKLHKQRNTYDHLGEDP